MDKDKALYYTKEYGRFKADVLLEYCLEMGKDRDETMSFLYILSMMKTSLYFFCYDYALEYYQRKFDIIIVTDKENRIVTAY